MQRISHIPITATPKYLANSHPLPRIQPAVNDDSAGLAAKQQKVILARLVLEDGGVAFSTGTRSGEDVNQDPWDVPLSRILDHVTPEELQRFENEDYKDEQAREEWLIANKPKVGRPRKHPLQITTTYTGFESTEEDGASPLKKSVGRPKKGHAVQLTKALGDLQTTSGKKRRGRPRKVGALPTSESSALHRSSESRSLEDDRVSDVKQERGRPPKRPMHIAMVLSETSDTDMESSGLNSPVSVEEISTAKPIPSMLRAALNNPPTLGEPVGANVTPGDLTDENRPSSNMNYGNFEIGSFFLGLIVTDYRR